MPLSPCRHHPDCLHAVATPGSYAVHLAFTATPGNHAIQLLLHCRDHTTTFSTPPLPLSSPSSGPRRLAVTAAPKTCIVLSAITGSTPPGCHHHAREPRHPLGRHRRRVHTTRPSPPHPRTMPSSWSSPPPGPCLSNLFHLQQFGKTLSLSLSLSLSLCKFHFAMFAYMIMLTS
jgi:hypothetical protein